MIHNGTFTSMQMNLVQIKDICLKLLSTEAVPNSKMSTMYINVFMKLRQLNQAESPVSQYT